jgi:hypothetical protein
MKVHLASFFVLLITIVSLAPAQEWIETISVEGNFKVLLPGEARYQSTSLDTGAGNIRVHSFATESRDGRLACVVFYNDYPVWLTLRKSAEQILNDARDGGVDAVRGRLIRETRITLDGHAGRELEITMQHGNEMAYASWRYYLVGNRLHQVGIVSVGQPVDEETKNKVFGSFMLLDR